MHAPVPYHSAPHPCSNCKGFSTCNLFYIVCKEFHGLQIELIAHFKVSQSPIGSGTGSEHSPLRGQDSHALFAQMYLLSINAVPDQAFHQLWCEVHHPLNIYPPKFSPGWGSQCNLCNSNGMTRSAFRATPQRRKTSSESFGGLKHALRTHRESLCFQPNGRWKAVMAWRPHTTQTTTATTCSQVLTLHLYLQRHERETANPST